VVDRSAGLRGGLTGDGHELDDLLGAEGGRASRPGGIGQHPLDQAPQRRLGRRLLLGLLQLGGGLEPAVAPVADGQAGQAQLLGRGFDARVVRQGQDDRGAADQPLVGRLLPQQPLEQDLLHRGKDQGNRLGSTHDRTPSATAGAIPAKVTI
jgi:hypothetical protein